jgi:hypothetical protein
LNDQTQQSSATPNPAPNGAAWAALIAGGAGGFAFGVLTILSEVFTKWASGTLQWYHPSGALSGVAGSAILIWLFIWAVLHVRWRQKQLQNQSALMIVTILLALAALLATFPPFYELLGG